jgi:hypothetical protein
MPLMPQPFVEHPNLRVPISLVVDDPTPCINPLWYFRHQVDSQAEPVYPRTIPLSFMEDWCQWVSDSGVCGDFTILPYPAGLGRIDQRLEGYDTGEVKTWLRLAREAIVPQFDIHCEILTHTNALDLTTGRLLMQSEHEWTEGQDEETLADYFAAAMQILGEAGLPNHGLTQPCTYRGDEALYARAVLAAEKRVNRRCITHNFLHMDSVSPVVPPRITLLDETAGEAVVSVWTGTDDAVWNTQEPGSAEQTQPPEALADRLLTADGAGGRLADLRRGGGPLVMVTHWQSLYSSGSGLGLRVHQEVARRVEALWGKEVEWSKLSDMSRRFLAARTARWKTSSTATSLDLTVSCPFATDVLTLSIPTPWPLYQAPRVEVNGVESAQAADAAHLEAGGWLMRGSLVTVSLPLAVSAPARVSIQM